MTPLFSSTRFDTISFLRDLVKSKKVPRSCGLLLVLDWRNHDNYDFCSSLGCFVRAPVVDSFVADHFLFLHLVRIWFVWQMLLHRSIHFPIINIKSHLPGVAISSLVFLCIAASFVSVGRFHFSQPINITHSRCICPRILHINLTLDLG